MKAEDLMIGDWVNLYGSPIKINIDDLCTIDRDETYDKGVHCKPIPLTSEILEKNCYSYNETRDAWELIPNNGFGICKDEDDNCFYFCLGIFDAFNSYSDITYHYITKVEYVHELQHSLKLCGIKKEIIL